LRLGTSTVAARIPYANAAPFYALWGEAPFAVRNLVPRELGREADAGGVDLGLMASADWLRMTDRFELLGLPGWRVGRPLPSETAALGVATRGPVHSVLLFSRKPPEALSGALVSVTPETSTSVRLLRLLLEVRRGLPDLRFIRGLEPSQADALLVIGDGAMRMRRRPPGGFAQVLDLGADWHDWTGLPFVYAVWAVRAALEDTLKAELRAFLDSSLAAGLADLPAVARGWTGPGWGPDEMEEYLRRFHYRLGGEDLAGLERFAALLERNDLLAD
jgi:chorismate dehydratase